MKVVIVLVVKSVLMNVIIPLIYNFFMMPFIMISKLKLPLALDFISGIALKITAVILHIFLGAVLYSLYNEFAILFDGHFIIKGIIYCCFLAMIFSIMNNFFNEQRINNKKLLDGIEIPGGNILNWTIKYLVLILIAFIVFTIKPSLANTLFNDY